MSRDGKNPPFIVFSSSSVDAIDVGSWDGHAQRFFGTRLRGTGAVIRVMPRGESEGARLVRWRERSDEDLKLAEEGERRAGGGGLVLLARRCPSVWQVTREGRRDRVALRLAMILASVHLGPIVDPRGPDLFGVKTARAKLDSPRATRMTPTTTMRTLRTTQSHVDPSQTPRMPSPIESAKKYVHDRRTAKAPTALTPSTARVNPPPRTAWARTIAVAMNG